MRKTSEARTAIDSYAPIEALFHIGIAAMLLFFYLPGFSDEQSFQVFSFMVVAGISRVLAAGLNAKSVLWSPGAQHLCAIVEYASNVFLGSMWGGLCLYAQFMTPLTLLNNPAYIFSLFIVILASLAGSSLRLSMFLAFSVPAVMMPLVLTVWSEQYDYAFFLGIIVLAGGFLGYASKQISATANIYIQLSRGNTELMKNLALARDEALNNQRDLQQANADIVKEIGERERAQQQIVASERELSAILDNMQDTFFRTDNQFHIKRVSPSVRILLGLDVDDVIDKPLQSLFYSLLGYQMFINKFNKQFGALRNYEVKLAHSLGHEVWVAINVHQYSDKDDVVSGIEGTIRDITENKRNAELIFQEKERLHVTLESIGDGVITTDMEGNVDYINAVGELMTGWSSEQAAGKCLSEVLQLIEEKDRRKLQLPVDKWIADAKRVVLDNPVVMLHNIKKTMSSIELTAAPIFDSTHGVIGVVLVFRDVTRLRSLAKRLSYQATHDSLTGLENRAAFEKRVKQAVDNACRNDKRHALCFLDLDQFKVVNDTCGHHAGDVLLKQVTSLLKSKLRESDTLSRLGGDEFGVLFMGCPLTKAAELADLLRSSIDQYRFLWEGKAFRVGLSIGVVQIDSSSKSLTDILSSADAACYVAKEHGRNYVHVYQPDDEAVARHHGQMQWMQRIQLALDNGHFELFYQPIVSVKEPAKNIRHGEILIRMVDHSRPDSDNLIYPKAFIPAAERYHLMPQIDRWVLENTFAALAVDNSNIPLQLCSINLSGQSLGDVKLLEFILELFRKNKISPKRICFEITESAVIANLEVAQDFIKRLKMMGCSFALDDFGSGLSSFGYLKSLPVDFVKLDGTLVLDIAASRVNHAMVQAINYVTHVMGIKSIAEYVETEEIFDSLRAINVDYAQGYGIGKPRPLQDFLDSIKQQQLMG